MISLFKTLTKGSLFHYGDNPNRKLVKVDDDVALSVTGIRRVNPEVAVIPEFDSKEKKPWQLFQRKQKS